MESAWISALAVAIAVPLAFAVLRRLFPAPSAVGVGRSVEDLRREYGKWELLCLPVFLAIAAAASYLWWRLLLSFATDGGFSSQAGVVTLRPLPIAWLIPALPLGILSAVAPVDWMLRGALGDRYREYVAYQNLRYGFDSEAVEKPFLVGFGALAAIGVIMIADWYVVFSPTEIRLNPFFGIRERTLRYADVVGIKTAPAFIAPNGNTVHRREYVLEFSDSSSWSTRFDPSEATEEQLKALVEVVSERSGVPVSEKPVLDRADFG